MNFDILNSKPLEFYNESGELIGTISVSGSGDMIISPESGSSRDIILGDRNTVGDVEIGLPSAQSTLNLMGGGTISANGNTLTIGDVAAGDSVIVNGPITASNILSASYALTASHALNSSGGGGSGIFEATGSIFATTNVLEITGSMTLINTASNSTSSNTLSIEGSGSVSGSGIFDVRGSVGQLFEVADGLDGVLMSVNDISGIPILTVSSSGDVILAEGSTLQGTAATASFVAGVSAAFPFAGTAVITGSLDITGSGDDIFKVRSKSGSLFSVDDGLDGILMSVNDISGLPLFEISSSGDVELIEGNISASAASTASFGKIIGNGNAQISGSLTFGGAAPTDLYSGGPKMVIDTSAIGGIKTKGALSILASADSSYNSRILFGTTNSNMSFGRRVDAGLSIRGVSQNYGWQLFGITHGYNNPGSGFHYTTNLPDTTFAENLTISGSGTYMSEPLKVHGSGSSVFEVIGTEGTLFAIDDSLSGSLFAVTNKTGIPRFEVFSDGKIEKQGNNIQDESFTWFMA